MKLPRRQFLRLGAGAAALPAIGRVAGAETYPARPIRLVVPFPPGGGFDTLARPWVEQVKPLLGTVIVENIGGGGSSLGAAAVARARPDLTPFCSAAPSRTSTRRCSKAGRSMIRLRTWIRLQAWRSLLSRLLSIHQCRRRTSKSSSLMPRPMLANCPTDTPVLAL